MEPWVLAKLVALLLVALMQPVGILFKVVRHQPLPYLIALIPMRVSWNSWKKVNLLWAF